MSNILVHLIKSLWLQMKFHWKLFSISERDIHLFFSSPYRVILIVFFTILFLPHVFVMVEDISLVRAYEVDPGSIVDTIESLYQPPHFYNMNVPYHSRFYGWTYYWINFLLAAPSYLLIALKVLRSYYFFLVSIRFILYLIGLASFLAFFEVARKFLNHNLSAFAAGLLYLSSPIISHFFYFIHPETTGLLFLFLGLLCLHKFHEVLADDLRWYTLALFSLTLSILSKHVFVFIAMLVFFLFLYVYCYHHQISIFRFVFSKKFSLILFRSLVSSAFIFFIINPFAFFQPRTFFTNQVLLFSTQTQGSLTEFVAIKLWLDIIWKMPVMWISIILSPLSLLGASLFSNQRVEKMFYIANLVGAIFFIFFSVKSMRYIIYDGYLAPVYPLFILNILSVFLFFLRKWNMRLLKVIFLTTLTYFLFFVLVKDFSVSLPTQWNRLKYQESPAYKSYQYIEMKIPEGKKIAHDQFIAIPPDKKIIGCHYWSGGCGTDYIEEFHPDYIIFAEDWTFQGTTVSQKMRLIKYIHDHDFVLIDTIPGTSLEVWKKPKNK